MKIRSVILFTTIVGISILSGCKSQTGSNSMDSMGAMSKSGGDMTAMCDMHKKMMDKSPQDQKMMMDEKMKNMSPEMRAQHMEMMKKCM